MGQVDLGGEVEPGGEPRDHISVKRPARDVAPGDHGLAVDASDYPVVVGQVGGDLVDVGGGRNG